MRFDTPRIMEILPHRPPFLLPRRVEVAEPGVCGIGFRDILPDDPFLTVDEHGAPCFPWFLALEMLAQTGAVISAAACLEEIDGSPPKPGFMVGASMRGLATIAVGQELTASVRIVKKWGRFIVGEGEARSGGRLAVTGSFTLTR
jgi:3-hydroxymyristoyl/3-hydroxydecanoyl-(acyl carrier protein) dehydratase